MPWCPCPFKNEAHRPEQLSNGYNTLDYMQNQGENAFKKQSKTNPSPSNLPIRFYLVPGQQLQKPAIQYKPKRQIGLPSQAQ